LIAFVRTSEISRRLTYFELAVHFEWGVIAVKGCLERAGYRRHVARVKPPISEKNRLDRIAWDSVSSEQLNDLIDTMHQRCIDVIKAKGQQTKMVEKRACS
jgi:hypothetical protein